MTGSYPVTHQDRWLRGRRQARLPDLQPDFLEDRPRYTPTSTFETFPFPWPLDTPDEALSDEQRAHRDAIGETARALDAEKRLKKRTLTNLYNERPTWLANLHDTLDAAVFAAYGWEEAPEEIGEEELLGRLLALNLTRAR